MFKCNNWNPKWIIDDIIVTVGENVEPLEIEEAAMRSRLIDQIVVIGQVLELSLKTITKILVSAISRIYNKHLLFTGSTTPWSYHNPKQRGSRKARSWNIPTKQRKTKELSLPRTEKMVKKKQYFLTSLLKVIDLIFTLFEQCCRTSECSFQVGPVLIVDEPFTVIIYTKLFL